MGVCTAWIEIDEDLTACGCPVDATPGLIQQSIDAATDILYRLSGQQYPGLCSETRRPCQANAACKCSSFNLCSCIAADVIVLPRDRVTAVTAVLVDGAVFTDYLLYPPNWLVRTDDLQWPCCQDLALPTTGDGTWSVTYSYGQEPPEGAKMAARVLTSELVKACTSDTNCRIPMGAVSVTQRGVTYDMTAFEAGKTGLPEVDLWLSSVNPKGRARKARIVSPDDIRFIPAIPVGS